MMDVSAVDRRPTRRLFSFPDPVNELAARTVAGGVVALSLGTLLLGALVDSRWLWLSVPLCYGFLARVATGPTLSPLGRVATRVVAPRLGAARPVPGPPKRFAQLLGTVMSAAAVLLVALGHPAGAMVFLGLIVVAAVLESAFAFCIGCRIFAGLMRLGVIPPETCAACADISRRAVTGSAR
jgi:hypothetical protein